MSEEQLSALLARLKEDAGLREKLQSAADLDAALALAQEAGFDISKADWLKFQAMQTFELSDEELEGVSGGTAPVVVTSIALAAAAALPLNAILKKAGLDEDLSSVLRK